VSADGSVNWFMAMNDVGTGVQYTYGRVKPRTFPDRHCSLAEDDLHAPRFERVTHELRCPIAHVSAYVVVVVRLLSLLPVLRTL
jgi:hypothetical protein